MYTFQDDASAVSEAINFLSENRKTVLKLSKENLKNIVANFIKNIDDRHIEVAGKLIRYFEKTDLELPEFFQLEESSVVELERGQILQSQK